MASEDDPSREDSKRVRVDPPQYSDRPSLHGLRITKTADAVILSGRVNSTDPEEILRRVEQVLSELASEDDEHSGSDRMKQPPSDLPQEDSGAKPADSAVEDEDVLNWDNLIPVAPPRPSRRIRVRLKKAQRGKPAPAEDPWAK
jgi:hypothetical protein